MPNLKAIEQISSTLTPSANISATLVSDNNISASLSNGITINQITGDVTPGISSPGGSNTQLQFNDSGLLGGTSTVTYNKLTNTLNASTINATIVNATFAGNGGNITNLDYTKITNPPVLADVATSGDYADLNGTPVLADVATSGDYADLSGTPVLAPVATSGLYSDLTGKPSLAPVAISGLYSDLTGKPVLGTAALVDATVFATAAQGAKADSAVQSITSADGSIAVTGTTTRDLSVVYSAQARTLVSTCRNNGTTMTPGTVVYISTAQGSQPVITRAQANAESTSTKTYGIVATTITTNGTGTVVVAGQLSGVNTNGLTTGATLWLSPTVAGGFTTTKPSAPDHAVVLGTVVYAHQNNGIIEVRVVNGYELEELHNVSLNGTTDGQVLTYESATQLWKATSPATAVSQLTNDAGYTTASAVAAGYQAKDNDLSALAALSGTGLARRTGVDTWVLDTSTFLTNITSGQIVTALGYTPYDAANPNAYITAADTVAVALVANSVAWTNVTGRPTALSQFSNDVGYTTASAVASTYQIKDADLSAIAALSGTGLARRTGVDTWVLDSSTFLTGITSGQIVTALGYTPYSAANPNAYITAADTVARALIADVASSVTWTNVSGKPSFSTVATTGAYADLSGKPTALSEFANDSGFITATTANTNYQAKDADLTTLAGLSDNGFVKRSGGAYVIDSTSVYLTGITSGQVTTALGYTPVNPSEKGAVNGVASLDSTGQVPLTQLPDSLENVVTVGTYSLLPVTGVADRIYIVDDSNLIYRWDDGAYKSITASVSNTDAVPEGATNKYFTPARARTSISASGSLSYDNVSGVISYTAPTLATVATSGVYSDLTGKPSALSQFTNDTNFTTLSAVAAAYQPLDSDLTGLAALSTNGIARRSGGVWTIDSNAYLTSYTETDPVFVASPSYAITNTNITNWQSSYSWGNHALAGYATTSSVASGYQPLDADLSSIAGLAGTTGLLRKTGANTFVLDTTTYLTSALIENVQPLDSDLTAISALPDSAGLLKKNSNGDYELDTNVYLTDAIIADVQPLSADLTAIDNLANTPGLVKKISDGNYELDTASYLTTSSAASTYQGLNNSLTSIGGLTGTTGLLRKTGAGTYTLDTATYLTTFTETDPVFVASPSYGITNTNITNWNSAYSWGNHASAGYATTSSVASGYQPLDADLTNIAGLSGTTGILKKTAANTWILDTATYLTSVTRVAEAVELDNGSQAGGLLGEGNGGAGRVRINTLAQDGNVDIDVAPITAAGGALSYVTAAKFTTTSIIPGITDTISLGSDSKRWSSVYVKEAGSATAPSINLAAGTTGATGFYSQADGTTITATTDGVARVAINGTGVFPTTDQTVALGKADYRWTSVITGAGSAALPSLAVGSSLLTTGLYSEALGTLSITNSGVKTGAIDSTGLTMVGKLEGSRAKVGLGSTSVVSYALSGNGTTNSGIYASSEGNFNVASLGNNVLTLDSSGNLTVTGALTGNEYQSGLGTAAAVAYGMSGTGATGTGMFSLTEGQINFASGGVEIGDITASGDLTMNGNITAYSDSRLKKDLLPIISALDKVMVLQGYTYTRVDSGHRHTGLIAQDVQKVLPEAVQENAEYLSVAYGNMMGLIVEAIKELNMKIDALGNK